MSRTLGLAALVVALGPSAGCGISLPVSSPDFVGDAGIRPYQPDASDAAIVLLPALDATTAANSDIGNPLCNATVGDCYPDLPTTAQACGLAADAGNDLAEDDLALACHVQPAPDGGAAAPVCLPAGPGGDGAPCTRSTDCAAGHECVAGGTCRQYCCAGSSACDAQEFCDVQTMEQDPGTTVPVCMPLEPCVLLEDTCPSGQSCQVVREDGATSCIVPGPAQVGASCDSEHCAADLVCLGATGARTCYALCPTASTSGCPAGQTCTGGLPLFTNPAVGWCH